MAFTDVKLRGEWDLQEEEEEENLARPLKQAYEDPQWLFGQVSHENMFMGVLGCFSSRHVHFKW